MIKAAGIGYAVANAVPEAKAVADRITVSNLDHAIARIIEDLDKEFS
jgi:hydroxymethylpyrimidine pyrophosphatase-like HAD family hydrolase